MRSFRVLLVFILIFCFDGFSSENRNPADIQSLKDLRSSFIIEDDKLISAQGKTYSPYAFESKLHSDLAYILKDLKQAKIIQDAYNHHIQPIVDKSAHEEKAFTKALLDICLLFGNPKFSPLEPFISSLSDQGADGKKWTENHLAEITAFVAEANTSIYSVIESDKDVFTVVVITTSCSGGNLSVANALTDHLSSSYPKIRVVQIDAEDVSKEEDPIFLATGTHTYGMIYSTIFQKTNDISVMSGRKELSKEIHRYLPSNSLGSLKQKVADLKPDLIISTRSYNPNDISLASLGVPFRMMHSDFSLCPSLKTYYGKVDPSSIRFWLYNYDPAMFKPLFKVYDRLELYDENDAYRTMMEKLSQVLHTPLRELERRFELIGQPISSDFFHIDDEQALKLLKTKWGVKEEEIPVFIAMGKYGLAASEEILNTLLKSQTHLPLKYLFICGKNAELKERLEEILREKDPALSGKFAVHGLLSPKEMNEVMNISQMGISKAGAASVIEVLTTKTHALLIHSYPWEEINASYLVKMGFGVNFDPTKSLIDQIEGCLKTFQKKPFYIFKNWQDNLTQRIDTLLSEGKLNDQESLYSDTIQDGSKGFSPVSFWESMEWKRASSGQDFKEDSDVKKAEQNFIRFCENLKKMPACNYDSPPSEFSIPPILHFIWIGSPLTVEAKRAIESWTQQHRGWQIRIWTDEEVKNFSWTEPRLLSAFEKAKTWAEKADILRLDILYQFGGIYSDIDVLCLRSFHDLIVQDVTFFSCFELNYNSRHYGSSFYVGTAVMGATRGSSLIKYCLDHCRTQEESPKEGILKRTGPGLVSRACQEAFKDPKEYILILPCSYLYPQPWKNRGANISEFTAGESLAVHLWNYSWSDHKTSLAVSTPNYITYEHRGGRFGDNLIAYLHAKWLAFQYQMPLLYKPFPYSCDLVLDDLESKYDQGKQVAFKEEKVTKGIGLAPTSNEASKIYVVRYFPESKWEQEYGTRHNGKPWVDYFSVAWKNPEFRKLAQSLIAPKHPLNLVVPPKDRISIAIHYREGGGYDKNISNLNLPTKFPPLDFYVEGILKMAQLFEGKDLYCYLFTDAADPKEHLEKLKSAIPSDINITFDCRWEGNSHDKFVVEDFFSLFQFDALIYPQSNFSMVPALIHDYAATYTVVSASQGKSNVIINEAKLELNQDVYESCLKKTAKN